MWKLITSEGFEASYKKFSKKHLNEANAVMNNLQTYLDALKEKRNVQQVNQLLPFVRSEPDGVIAIEQRGAKTDRKNQKLKATRLYLYVIEINQVIYLLRIGDKDSQKQDLQTIKKKVNQIKKEIGNNE